MPLALLLLTSGGLLIASGVKDPAGGPLALLGALFGRTVTYTPHGSSVSAAGLSAATSGATALATGKRAAVTGFATAQLGKPYRWAGAGPDAWDCSGLTMVAYAQAGLKLPHYSASQATMGKRVNLSDARPGDIVCYGIPCDHVAIYMGDGTVIAAPHTGDVVRHDPIGYYGTPSGIRSLLP